MSRLISAVYKDGHFIPLTPVSGLRDEQPVELRVKPSLKPAHHLSRFVGIISVEEAKELSEIIAEEFEKVNPPLATSDGHFEYVEGLEICKWAVE